MDYKEGKILTIQVGEHEYRTPPIPKKKDILFHDKKKENQFWTRQTDLPRIFYDWHDNDNGIELDAVKTKYSDAGILVALSKEDTSLLFDRKEENGREGYQEREYRRRTEGLWFYNNGEPTYLTGDHYAALQWLPMLGCQNDVEPGSNYGQYFDFQRDVCYYFKICEETDIAFGGVLIKPKKTGITQLISSICLNRAMLLRQKNIRMMSITESICKDVNFRFIRHSLEGVPPILMPSRSKQNESEVIFGSPNFSRNPLKKSKATFLEYLNTWLTTVPTARTSFDSATNYIAFIDEFPKIIEVDPEDLFIATIAAVKEGVRRKGTVFGCSYCPEISNNSFRKSKTIYYGSKKKTRLRDKETGEPYGKTKSELLCHTLVVQEGIFGCCDKYGKPIEKAIWDFIRDEKEKAKNNPVELQRIQRQYPTNENDPWSEGLISDTLFDTLRLSRKADALEERMSMGDYPYKDFNLEFEKRPVKDPKSEQYKFEGNIRIKWVSDDEKILGAEHGRFKWFNPDWTPAWFLGKYLNKVIKDPKTGMLKPNPDSPFFIAVDPTNWRISKNTGKTSKNALQVFVLPNSEVNSQIGKNVTNRRLMVSYLYRCDKPSDTLDDIIKLMLLFGCMVQIESNMSTWVTNLVEMGLGNFLLTINKDGALEPFNQFKWNNGEQTYFTSSKPEIDMYVTAGQEFLAEPFISGEIDNIDYLDDFDVITQLMLLTKEDTTAYDAAVAYLEGLMAIDGYLGWKRGHEKRKGTPDEKYREFALNMLH